MPHALKISFTSYYNSDTFKIEKKKWKKDNEITIWATVYIRQGLVDGMMAYKDIRLAFKSQARHL